MSDREPAVHQTGAPMRTRSRRLLIDLGCENRQFA
jgi:hypothetical protein